ncbi:hypothetical protein Patl1_33223 [Pistacia atlantica]|uniref:Uncharacterized protein n=1 Tax=Pistacia atlantica TaxID=434234 RepID=A0ACC1ALQ2_9ROSI|nr:hypothetical protein Patl1_33223 [Pistacia atlantica]
MFEQGNMVIRQLLRSSLRAQLGSYQKHVAASRSLQENLCRVPLLARLYGTEASLQKEDDLNVKGFKGHDMLAPFTAGWQTNDLHPLVIEKSEGSYVYDTNGKKYLDALAGLWCTALGINSMSQRHFSLLLLLDA